MNPNLDCKLASFAALRFGDSKFCKSSFVGEQLAKAKIDSPIKYIFFINKVFANIFINHQNVKLFRSNLNNK
ncbi:hypothetical protein BAY32_07800 [Elizabethkingia ursingii]|uniref:Uncharacterized protein n=1 Tax=Elizabethkingia ursingii TaxID=1756150 RepID=A0AAJ3NCD2_9FLAO|nr:hypothetical protein BBD34_14050 [Elizabethkingia ursingii]OPB75425.1 hypothetical protein BAY32_07800 [Elizabethkingia ursingii]